MADALCRHCCNPERTVNRPRGLCWSCFEDHSIREQYPSGNYAGQTDVKPACVGCGRSDCNLHARNLCAPCYRDPAIRAATPTLPRGRRAILPPWGDREPTMQELDELIAQQLPTMPRGKEDIEDVP